MPCWGKLGRRPFLTIGGKLSRPLTPFLIVKRDTSERYYLIKISGKPSGKPWGSRGEAMPKSGKLARRLAFSLGFGREAGEGTNPFYNIKGGERKARWCEKRGVLYACWAKHSRK